MPSHANVTKTTPAVSGKDQHVPSATKGGLGKLAQANAREVGVTCATCTVHAPTDELRLDCAHAWKVMSQDIGVV